MTQCARDALVARDVMWRNTPTVNCVMRRHR